MSEIRYAPPSDGLAAGLVVTIGAGESDAGVHIRNHRLDKHACSQIRPCAPSTRARASLCCTASRSTGTSRTLWQSRAVLLSAAPVTGSSSLMTSLKVAPCGDSAQMRRPFGLLASLGGGSWRQATTARPSSIRFQIDFASWCGLLEHLVGQVIACVYVFVCVVYSCDLGVMFECRPLAASY